jgi:hypothetical protein
MFLGGKHNRRMDFLIYTLIRTALPDYEIKQDRQEAGIEGPDLKGQAQARIEKAAQKIELSMIKVRNMLSTGLATSINGILQASEDDTFLVRSSTNPEVEYLVVASDSICSCDSFGDILHCKHLAAARIHFPESFAGQLDQIHVELCQESEAPNDAGSSQSTANDKSVDRFDSQTAIKQLERTFQRLKDATTDQSIISIEPHAEAIQIALDSALSDVLRQSESMLPRPKNLPPNLSSARETERAYAGALPSIKTKRPRNSEIEGNPYSGGERSGKYAKADALARPGAISASQPPPTKASPPNPALLAPAASQPARPTAMPVASLSRPSGHPQTPAGGSQHQYTQAYGYPQ